MALSGSFKNSIINGKYTLRVDWSASQSVTGNTSKITLQPYLVQASGYALTINSRSDNTASIAGTSYTWGSPAINGKGLTTKLATITSGNIAHNADGTKSVTLSCTFYIRATISGTYYEKITASATVTLDTIPRATQPTLSAASMDMGSSVTINLPRAVGSFTHDLAYSFAGGSWVSIATGVGTSYSWSVPDLATSIPNAASGTMTIRCTTMNGSTTIGTKTALLTAKVPASVVPSITSVSTAEAVAGLAAQFGMFVQYKSKVKATIAAAGAKGSTIVSYSSTFAGKTWQGSSWTTDEIQQSGSLSLVVTVTDSRGRTKTGTYPVTVLEYYPPRVPLFTVARVGDTNRVELTYAYEVCLLNYGNTADMRIEYKRSMDTYYNSTPVRTSAALSGSADHLQISSPTFSTDYQYDLRLTVTDYFGAEASYTVMIPSGRVIMDFKANGLGVSLGKTAELDGFEVDMPPSANSLLLVGVRDALIGSGYGYIIYNNGLCLQWGVVSITPTAANTATQTRINFTIPYTGRPHLMAAPQTNAPQTLSWGVGVGTSEAQALSGMVIYLTKTSVSATAFNWAAIGRVDAASWEV